jgi:hypothetical protein
MSKQQHHPFGPSSLPRRAACPGSYELERGLPEPPQSDDARRGIDLHALIARSLRSDASAADAIDLLSPDDATDVRWGLAEIARMMTPPPDEVAVEVPIPLYYLDNPDEGRGTPDLVLFRHATLMAHVIDIKTGRETPMEPDNLQLLAYALLAEAEYSATTVDITLLNITRRESRFHTLGPVDINRAYDRIRQIIVNAQAPNAPRHVGDHCRYCRAAGVCPERRAEVTELATVAPGAIAPADFPRLLNALQRVEKVGEEIRRQAREYIAAGGTIEGWGLRPFVARCWANAAQADDELAARLEAAGVNAEERWEPRALRTPAALERIVGKSAAARKILEGLVAFRPGAPRLVKDVE